MTGRSACALATFLILAAPLPAAANPVCAIDMGSNTFRRIVGSFDNGRYTQTDFEEQTVGVGDDLARHGRISDAKLAEVERVLTRFAAACAKDVDAPPVAIGTAAFRDAPNGPAVVALAARRGIRMEIATETRESELAYLVASLGADDYAVVDNGSRSIELVAREGGRLRHVVFDLGYRVAWERFFAPAREAGAAVQALERRVRAEAAKAPFMQGRKKLVGIEFRDMARVLFRESDVEGRVFTRAALRARLHELRNLDAAAFRTLKARPDIDRALPRLVVAVALMEQFDYEALALTARELGAGLIIEAGRRR